MEQDVKNTYAFLKILMNLYQRGPERVKDVFCMKYVTYVTLLTKHRGISCLLYTYPHSYPQLLPKIALFLGKFG